MSQDIIPIDNDDEDRQEIIAAPFDAAEYMDAPMPGESEVWFERFCLFRDMGPDRTKLAAYKRYQELWALDPTLASKAVNNYLHPWTNQTKLYHWDDRAAAWDRELFAERRRIEKASREKHLEEFQTTMDWMHAKIIQGFKNVQFDELGKNKPGTLIKLMEVWAPNHKAAFGIREAGVEQQEKQHEETGSEGKFKIEVTYKKPESLAGE